MRICARCFRCYDDTDFVCSADGQTLEVAWPDSRFIAGKYQLETIIARGGMGVIYRARQLELNREVAVKILSPQLILKERMAKQFHREALAIARLDHPNIVPIYDYGTLPGNNGAYLIMRLVQGRQLSDEIIEGPIALPRALMIIEQVCEGISAAHEQNIIHCDLKPDNILLERNGRQETVQIVDFGIAKLKELNIDGGANSAITDSAIGTPQYMSPEQCCGEPISTQADLYSLGVIVFEMLTGRVPFKSLNPIDVAKHHVRTPPPLPSMFNRDIPSKVDQVIIKALGKMPNDRQKSVRIFFEELRDAADSELKRQQVPSVLAVAASHSGPLAEPVVKNINLLEQKPPEEGQIQVTQVAAPKVTASLQSKTNSYFDTVEKRPPSAMPVARSAPELFPLLSVLIADDDEGNKLFTNMLQDMGCDFQTTNDGATAWDYLSVREFNLVICNTVLNSKSGWQLFQLAQTLPFPPMVIFTSGEDNEEERLQALEIGVEDYWTKPLEPTELYIRIKRLLQRINAERIKKLEVQKKAETAKPVESLKPVEVVESSNPAETAMPIEPLQSTGSIPKAEPPTKGLTQKKLILPSPLEITSGEPDLSLIVDLEKVPTLRMSEEITLQLPKSTTQELNEVRHRAKDAIQEEHLDQNSNFETDYAVGLSYREYGLLEDAIEEMSRAIDRLSAPHGSTHFRCCCDIADCYIQLSNKAEAHNWLLRALSIPGLTEEDKSFALNQLEKL